MEAKYASPNIRKTNNRGENLSGKPEDLERNAFSKFMTSHKNSKMGENKMAAIECKSDDNEILIKGLENKLWEM